ADARAALDREANARRWLVDAFGSLAVGDGSGAFEGRGDRVEFGSWQQSERGWLRRERIGLARRSQQFVASLGSERELVLADGISALEFDYLLDPGDASTTVDSAVGALGERARFVREWISPVSAPVAVRVRVGHAIGTVDTLLLIVGPRG
ncbi:MAG: hypothetical protein ACRDKS_16285, partial [Actinomycetota bacterium]